jgi:hypothetical protein
LKRYYIILFVLICSFSSLIAAGSTGLSFLKIGVGARATSMGGAFTALADDATGLFWNPAGPAWLQDRYIHFTHNSWIQGINQNVANVSFPAFNGTFGIGLILNNIGDIERRTIASEEPLGTFSAHDFSIGINYAKKIGENLSVGFNGKFINEKIYFDSASGFALDLGVKYQLSKTGFIFGGALQNLGSMNELAEQDITLPQTIRLGAAYVTPFTFMNSTCTVSADYVKVQDDDGHIYLGTEVQTLSTLMLRAGYQTGFEERDVSVGFGLVFNRFIFDYAYIPFSSDLGSSQRISFIASF